MNRFLKWVIGLLAIALVAVSIYSYKNDGLFSSRLSPEKTVLVPSNKAGCSLASSITASDVRKLKTQFPGVPVVTYINTYADVKAETDICCTSGNAKEVVESLNSDAVIFLPDEYLAGNVAKETGKHIIRKSGKITNADKSTNLRILMLLSCSTPDPGHERPNAVVHRSDSVRSKQEHCNDEKR